MEAFHFATTTDLSELSVHVKMYAAPHPPLVHAR